MQPLKTVGILTIFILKILETSTEKLHFCDVFQTNTVTIPDHFMSSGSSKNFSAVTKDVNCSGSYEELQLRINSTFASDDYGESTAIPELAFYPSGDIIVKSRHYYLNEEYCISSFNDETIEVKFCKVKCGKSHVCINKCCPPHQVVDFSTIFQHGSPSCITNFAWKPVFYDSHQGCGVKSTSSSYMYHWTAVDEAALLDHRGFQPYKYIVVNGSEHIDGLRFRLMKDGALFSQTVDGKWERIKQQEFCVDGMTGYEGSKIYSGEIEDQLFLFGTSEEEFDSLNETHEHQGRLAYFYITMLFIGCAFLLATAILYLLIWEKHNIHGWTIFAFVCNMLFMFIFLAVSYMVSISEANYEFGETPVCKSIGILAHFFYLSTMCWLTVINVDLWLTFRNVKPTGGISKTITRFLLYALFSFLVPLGIVAFAITVNYIYEGSFGDGSHCEPPFTLPLYGQHQCFLQKDAYWPYLYVPMSILITCNIVTFASTAFTLCLYRKQTRNAINNGASNQKESFLLFMKLFVVTGTSWVLELLSNIPGNLETWWFLWLIFDFYNLLQAFLIFIIFALKRENVVFLYYKYPSARFFLRPIMRTPCCYSQSFDVEHTDVTGVPYYDHRNSRIQFRRGSSMSSTRKMSATSEYSGTRRSS